MYIPHFEHRPQFAWLGKAAGSYVKIESKKKKQAVRTRRQLLKSCDSRIF